MNQIKNDAIIFLRKTPTYYRLLFEEDNVKFKNIVNPFLFCDVGNHQEFPPSVNRIFIQVQIINPYDDKLIPFRLATLSFSGA